MNEDINQSGWVIKNLDKVGVFSSWVSVLGAGALFLMICLTFVDVFMRYLFNSPIKGVYDVTQVMLIVVVFLGIAHTQNEKGHVAIDVITERLSTSNRLVMNTITAILGIGIFVILIWRSYHQFWYFLETGAIHSQYIQIPSAPFAAVIPFGCTLLLLLLLRDVFNNISQGRKLHLSGYQWFLMLGMPVFIAALAAFWVQPSLWNFSGSTIGILGVVFSLLLMFIGLPVSFSLIMASILFIAHIQGTSTAFSVVGVEVYRTTSSYTWSVLAFFVFMGYVCLYAKFGEDLYYAAYRWVGRMSGGLAIATISACTAFAAIVGSGLSAVVTMGAVALPEMNKYRYDKNLSSGSIIAGATLGPIIPPSTNFIIYAILTQQSIGRLFVAGIIPGLILAISFSIIIYIRCRLHPKLGPPGAGSTWKEKVVSLKAGGPVAILFLVVIGGLYAGVFTPTEAGGIGCAGALIFGLFMKRLSWRSFNSTLLESGKTTAMIFLILSGGILFARFIAFCNLSDTVTQFLTGLSLPSAVVILIILLLFFILGFFIDIVPLILIGVPVVHPVAVTLGYDPIWFTVLAVIVIGLGTITPPVGINLFSLKGVAREIPMGTIFRGAMPFVFATIIVVGLIFIFPSLATWLPSLLY